MLTYEEVLNLNYYKKTTYTGWMEGMRFLIKREQPTVTDPETGEEKPGDAVFHVWLWPGPYIYELTPGERKYTAQFPFSEDGKRQAVDWINEQFEAHRDEWPKRKLENY
jgi:hypothetical protein